VEEDEGREEEEHDRKREATTHRGGNKAAAAAWGGRGVVEAKLWAASGSIEEEEERPARMLGATRGRQGPKTWSGIVQAFFRKITVASSKTRRREYFILETLVQIKL
jgi:hypothetical protein